MFEIFLVVLLTIAYTFFALCGLLVLLNGFDYEFVSIESHRWINPMLYTILWPIGLTWLLVVWALEKLQENG